MKCAALLGVATALPAHTLLAEDTPASTTLVPKPMGDGLFVISYGKEIEPAAAKPRTITIPNTDGFNVLKGDFHMHTLFSDGRVMPKDRVREAVTNGFDVIAITDHIEYRPNFGNGEFKFAENNDDHNRSYNLAKPDAEKNNLILVRGTEITKSVMPPGHFNALFVQDVNQIAAVVDNWKAMLAVAADQGGFIQWNHPGWVAPSGGGLEKGVPMSFTDEHEDVRAKGHLHGVEVFNSTEFYPLALDWCNERDLAPMANSDIHASEWNAHGHQNLLRPMTLIFSKDRTEAAIREAFFAKRTIGWAANMIFGRPEWVEKLFRSCIKITKSGSGLTLQNTSDIPCLIETGGKSANLAAQGTLNVAAVQKLTVGNWFVGLNKPLGITVQ